MCVCVWGGLCVGYYIHLVLVYWYVLMFIIKTRMHGFFDSQLHQVSWHFATGQVVLSSTDRVKMRVKEPIQSKNPFKMYFYCFIQHFKSQYNRLILSKLSRKTSIYSRWSPWLRNWTLCNWSRARPTLTWLAKLVFVAVGSSVRNTNFPDNLRPCHSRTNVV